MLVVGAGISGALIAEMLARDGHRVLVVDRRGPALGSTAANTASSSTTRADAKRRLGITGAAGLLSHGNFALDPRRLTAGYLRAAHTAGGRLAAPVEVVEIDNTRQGVVAHSRTARIACRTVVFATGYEFPDFVPISCHRLISTYAMATRPQPRRLWFEQCLIWEASDPYLYGRTTPDGRAIFGGEDEDFVDEGARDALLAEKVKAIGRKAKHLFPDLDTAPDFAWTGTFGSSDSGLPTVAPISRHARCWAVLGYGGNGITYSRIAAEIIRTALAGRTDPDADLYAFA